jgi:hypothetical protein
MHIRAERDPRFYLRFNIIGWVAMFFALYCLYDGFVTYPRQRERGLLFQQLMEEKRDSEWDKEAAKRGWPTEYPGEPKSETDIKMQFAMAALSGTIGALVLLNVLMSRGRWIEADDTGLNSSWGERVPYDRIVSLDKKIWKNKGIARVKYDDNGKIRKFVIDDFKFKRQATDDILYELEERIDPDKIIGGPPEPLKNSGDVTSEPAGEEAPTA